MRAERRIPDAGIRKIVLYHEQKIARFSRFTSYLLNSTYELFLSGMMLIVVSMRKLFL